MLRKIYLTVFKYMKAHKYTLTLAPSVNFIILTYVNAIKGIEFVKHSRRHLKASYTVNYKTMTFYHINVYSSKKAHDLVNAFIKLKQYF